MNRDEKRTEKKHAIIFAVQRVLAAKGYEGVTMKRVATEAGISQGLLHYYFKDKEEMMVETMQANVAYASQLYSEAFDKIQPGEDVAAVIVNQFRALIKNNPDFFNIFLECWPLLMHTSEEMRLMNRSLFEDFKKSIRDELWKLVRRECITPDIPLDDLTSITVALFDGLGFQIHANPAMAENEDLWKSIKECLRPWLKKVPR